MRVLRSFYKSRKLDKDHENGHFKNLFRLNKEKLRKIKMWFSKHSKNQIYCVNCLRVFTYYKICDSFQHLLYPFAGVYPRSLNFKSGNLTITTGYVYKSFRG